MNQCKKCFWSDLKYWEVAQCEVPFCFLLNEPCRFDSNISLCQGAVPAYLVLNRMSFLLGCDYELEIFEERGV